MGAGVAGAGGPGEAVRMTPSREVADEWAVVLAAESIPHRLRRRIDGWALLVSPRDAARAAAALDAYDRENAPVRTAGDERLAPVPGAVAVGLAIALLLIGFFAVTGARGARGAWFERGSADAARIVAGEWWRAVTALTLHADAPHVLANAVASALLLPAVFGQLGPGVGLWLLLVAGAGGNVLTAAVHAGHHVSVGASTAVFGAIGMLAGLRLVGPGRARSRPRKWWVVVVTGLALLVLLGAAPDADLFAHLFGFLVGGALGVGAAAVRGVAPAAVQWPLVAAAGAAIAAAWRAAV